MKSTHQAMEAILQEKSVWKRLGYAKNTWFSIVNRYKAGKLTYDKIYEVIEAAGYTLKQERMWTYTPPGQYPEQEINLQMVEE